MRGALVVGARYLVAGIARRLVQIDAVIAGARGVEQAATGEVVEPARNKLLANLAIVLARLLMGVEGRRRRVVQIHAGEHAYLVAELALQFLGDGLEALGSVRRHVDDPAGRLAPRGNGGGRGGGIRAERGAIVGVLGTDDREVHEAHALDGRFFPSLLGTVEVGRRLNLRVAHAVADEEEHVLRHHGRRASLRPAFTGGSHGHRTWLARGAAEQCTMDATPARLGSGFINQYLLSSPWTSAHPFEAQAFSASPQRCHPRWWPASARRH